MEIKEKTINTTITTMLPIICLIIFILLLIYTAIYYVLALNLYLDGVELETLKKNTFIKQLITFTMVIVILIIL